MLIFWWDPSTADFYGDCKTSSCSGQIREENAKRQHDNAAAQLRTCTDHRCTMDALLNPDGVPSDFLAGADNSEAASLAQQPWYRILYVAQVEPIPNPP